MFRSDCRVKEELAEHLGHIQSSVPHGGKLPHQAVPVGDVNCAAGAPLAAP